MQVGVCEMRDLRDCAICYVCDINFLWPTLVSATSLRRWVTPSAADIFLFTIGIDADTSRKVAEACESLGLTFLPLDDGLISGFDESKFARTHVPRSSLGRFFLADHLPRDYDRILYIDGDTWIVRDPTPLIRYRPPPDVIAAGEDPAFFIQSINGSMGSHIREYFAGLGIDGPNGYFNSGVLMARLPTWRAMMAEAFEFFRRNVEKCSYHDQSALNAVARHRRVRLSPRWNFTTPYRHWGVESKIAPCIYHFIGAVKPWMGKCEPWAGIHDAYMEDWRRFASLDLPARRFDARELTQRNRAAIEQTTKLKLLFARRMRYRTEIRRLHESAVEV